MISLAFLKVTPFSIDDSVTPSRLPRRYARRWSLMDILLATARSHLTPDFSQVARASTSNDLIASRKPLKRFPGFLKFRPT